MNTLSMIFIRKGAASIALRGCVFRVLAQTSPASSQAGWLILNRPQHPHVLSNQERSG